MGRKLDLSGLTDNEAEHVLQVVQRDMKLRNKEEKRLSELKQELDEEGSRCLLLSRQSCFNQRCCIRCCLPFTFLFNPKRQCQVCRYNVCRACRVYDKQHHAWLCSSCRKSRLLKTQSLEWFYTNVKQRFKRFGSAKVLKTLYRKHRAEHSVEGSGDEESVCNGGSVCGSDSAFFRQSEEHSVAETLAVALRVAEEAIDEAISKAEFDTDSQEKQNEAQYLQQHRGELIEELAQTIVQKIISSRKTLADTREKNNQDWPLKQNTGPHHHHHHHHHPASSSLHQPGLWRSHSAFSLLDNETPALIQDSVQATLTAWKSADRLDDTGEVLQSPHRNWIALQSIQLSRPSLLTQRKSLVHSALERESGVVSDKETEPEPDSSWGAALREIQVGKVRRSRKKRRSKKEQELNQNDRSQPCPDGVTSDTLTRDASTPEQFDLEGDLTGHGENLTLNLQELSGQVCDKETGSSDDGQRRGMEETDGEGERFWKMEMEEEEDLEMDEEMERRLYEVVEHSKVTYLSSTDDELDKVNQREGELDEDDEEQEGLAFTLCRLEKQVKASQFSSTEDELDRVGVEEKTDEELAVKVCKLANQVNATQFSSTEDELDRAGRDGEEEMEEQMLWKLQAQKAVQAAHLRDLSSLVGTARFSSTEDELDEAGKCEGQRKDACDTAEERRESFADLDVKMFDLKDEAQESKGENADEKATTSDSVLDNRIRTYDVQHVKDEMIEECMCADEAGHARETQKRQEMELKNMEQGSWAEAERLEDKFDEATANSDEEDAEFDRIISSMLTMTLEDMQGGAQQESGRTNLELEDVDDRVKTRSGFKDQVTDEKGSEKELQKAREALTSGDRDEQEEGERRRVSREEDDEDQRDGRGRMVTQEEECDGRETSSGHQGFLSPEEILHRYSAVSLCSITTEALKLLNATEELLLLQGVEGGDRDGDGLSTPSLPPNTDAKKLDQQFCRLEENVYVAAGAAYGLEAELTDLEERAGSTCASTPDLELSFLEEQVASAAARVQHSELQICDISARIAALRSAGLVVDTQAQLTTTRTAAVTPVSLDSTRHVRRRLPAPPAPSLCDSTGPVFDTSLNDRH